jgi:hypothetical protein
MERLKNRIGNLLLIFILASISLFGFSEPFRFIAEDCFQLYSQSLALRPVSTWKKPAKLSAEANSYTKDLPPAPMPRLTQTLQRIVKSKSKHSFSSFIPARELYIAQFSLYISGSHRFVSFSFLHALYLLYCVFLI